MNLKPDFSALEGFVVAGTASLYPPRAGDRPSVRTGLGFDFAEFRALQPGDPLVHFDWRRYAATRGRDRIVRRFYRDLSADVLVVLESSGSMSTYEEDAKWDNARRLALALAGIAIQNREVADLVLVGQGGAQGAAPHETWRRLTRERDLDDVADALLRLRAQGVADTATLGASGEIAGGQYGAGVLITDAVMEADQLTAVLNRLQERVGRLHVVRMVGAREQEPAKSGEYLQVYDAESGREVEISFNLAEYQELLASHFTDVARVCETCEVTLAVVESAGPWQEPDLLRAVAELVDAGVLDEAT